MPDEPQDAPDQPPILSTLDMLPAINPLACYRVCTVARGLAELNLRLAEGWQLIRTEFCEEIIRAGQGPNQQRAQIIYQPYSVLGKRETLVETDRQAMEQADARNAMAAAMPLDAEGDAGAPGEGTPGQAEEATPASAPKVGIPARRTHDAGRGGFEPQGGLRR